MMNNGSAGGRCSRDTLFTTVFLNHLGARFAFHLATPMEFAVAPFFDDDFFGVVATTAAQNSTSIQT